MRAWHLASTTPTQNSLGRTLECVPVADLERELTQSWLETRLASEVTSCTDTRALVDTYRPDHGVDFMWRDADGSIVVAEVKKLRRGHRGALEREALNEQLEAYRAAAAASELAHAYLHRGLHLVRYSPDYWTQFPNLWTRATTRPLAAGEIPDHAGQPSVVGHTPFESLLSALVHQVVVSREVVDGGSDGGIDAPPEQHDHKATPERLRVEVFSLAEAFRRRVDQTAARKRLGMVLRTRLASLPALVHAAVRHLTPPGRLVATSPSPTRGPNNAPLKTITSFLSGMSLAYA